MFGSCCGHEEGENSVEDKPAETGTTTTTVRTTSTTPLPELSTTATTTKPTTTTTRRPPTTPTAWSTYYTQRPFSNHSKPVLWHPTTTASPPSAMPNTTGHLIFIDPSSPPSPPPLLESIDKSIGCGRAPLHSASARIVGGAESPFASWPWLASVRRTSFFGFSSTHRCGGALINEEWVATEIGRASCRERV